MSEPGASPAASDARQEQIQVTARFASIPSGNIQVFKELVDTAFGMILEIEEVDDCNVDLLAVAMAATDALLDALRVPGKVEINQH